MTKDTKKRSFFERLSGGIRLNEEDAPENTLAKNESVYDLSTPEEEADGELALDVYQTPGEIIVQTFVAGVKPEDLEINITRDMLTVRGKRITQKTVDEDNYFSRELYWGSFSRTVSLPAEVEPDEAEAVERHGLLTIRMPKIDKDKRSNLKVKSV